MSINAWKTSFIGINKPPKVVTGVATGFTIEAMWPYANKPEDPYWVGGTNPQPYKWRVTFTTDEMFHGSHLTRTPYRFTANDIEVGDFVSGADDGKVCQIMSIISKDDFNVVAIVEDRLRYNTFRSPVGNGLFNCPGNVVFFQINELGFPMIDPVPGIVSSTFADNIVSRFQYMNPLTNYLLEKEDNGFEQGDAICIEDGEFVLSDPDNVSRFIGTVVFPGPGPHQFILRPANGIIDFVPGLPGEVGDYIYPSIDGSGDLTTNDASRRPVFMKIADAIPSETIGTSTSVTVPAGCTTKINDTVFSLATGGLTQLVDSINAYTSEHKVVADKINAPVVIETNFNLGSAYGIVGGFTPFSASINGVVVNFTTTTNGSVAFGDPAVADAYDIAEDINDANIPYISASVSGTGGLILRNQLGQKITIVNITPDVNGNNFAGPASITSIPTTILANTSTFVLRLTRADGGPMTIRDIEGTVLASTGVLSGQSGRYALGLNIEQGLRTSATTVVANMAARDALYPLIGDQVYVIDDGNGEWAMFLYDGASWTNMSNKRSSQTDAKTLEYTIDFSQSVATPTQFSIGSISEGRRVENVTIHVAGSAARASISVGTSADPELLLAPGDVNVSVVGSYKVETDYITTEHTEMFVTVTGAEISGDVTVILTYV